jgi:hypothetical protein
MAIAHPPTLSVTLSGGQKVTLRPWTMAQRAELRPRILDLLGQLSKVERGVDDLGGISLVDVFVDAEEAVTEIVRASISLDALSEEAWGEMGWTDDLPLLAQGIWDLNLAGPGGVLGKLGAGLGSAVGNALASGALKSQSRNRATKTAKSGTSSKRKGSASSPDAGAPLSSV